MMGKRQEVLAAPVPAYAERRRRIEAEPLPANIGALIDAAADEAGDALLWDFFESGETITYSEMRRTVNGLATRLVALGITKGTHIGVMLPNIAALPLTWLAIGRIGAVMVPINVSYRERELAHVVSSADVTCSPLATTTSLSRTNASSDGQSNAARWGMPRSINSLFAPRKRASSTSRS